MFQNMASQSFTSLWELDSEQANGASKVACLCKTPISKQRSEHELT